MSLISNIVTLGGMGIFPLFAATLLLAIVLIVVAAFWRRRRHAAMRADGSSPDIVALTQIGAIGYGALVLVVGIWQAAHLLIADVVSVEVPIEPFWPGVPGSAELGGMGANIVDANITRVDMDLEGLSTATRVFLALGVVASSLMVLTVALLVVLTCRNLRQGTPFARVVARAASVASGVVLAGGILGSILTGIGTSRASSEALDWSSFSAECAGRACSEPETFWPTSAMTVGIPFWPIGVALVLAVLALMIRRGAALQDDTEGLV